MPAKKSIVSTATAQPTEPPAAPLAAPATPATPSPPATNNKLSDEDKSARVIKYFNDTYKPTVNINDTITAAEVFKKMKMAMPEVKMLIFVFYNILRDNNINITRATPKAAYHIVGYMLK
jgi:hypothetical protein